jgi:hypothetical protein
MTSAYNCIAGAAMVRKPLNETRLKICWTVALHESLNKADKDAFLISCDVTFLHFRDYPQLSWAGLIEEWKDHFTAIHNNLLESVFDRLVFRVVCVDNNIYHLRICTIEECDEEQHPLLEKFVKQYMYLDRPWEPQTPCGGPLRVAKWSAPNGQADLMEMSAVQVHVDWRHACPICHNAVLEKDVDLHARLHHDEMHVRLHHDEMHVRLHHDEV